MKLAVAVPEHWPRWVNIVLFFLAGTACLAPTVWFLLDRTYTTFGLLEVLFGTLGVFSLVLSLRFLVLSILIGDTTVEISREPAVVGDRLEYFILQGRPASTARDMAARVVLRRYGRRSAFTEAVSVPLGPATVESDGRRKIQGSLVVPPIPPAGLTTTSRLEWIIDVRVRFKGGFEHEEERPFLVEEKEKPPTV